MPSSSEQQKTSASTSLHTRWYFSKKYIYTCLAILVLLTGVGGTVIFRDRLFESNINQKLDNEFVSLKYMDGIGSSFSRSPNEVRYGTTTITGADPTTFVLLNDASGRPTFHAKDKYSVYFDRAWSDNVDIYENAKLKGADPASFKLLENQDGIWTGWAVDHDHVWFDGDLVEAADANTFKLELDAGGKWTGFASDANLRFFQDNVVK